MRLWAGLIAHPLQRPLALSRGLSAQAFWEPSTFPWLAGLLRPDSIAKMQRGEHSRLQTTFLAPTALLLCSCCCVFTHRRRRASELGEADAALDEEAQIEGIHLGGGWGEVHLIRAGRVSESGTPPCPFTHLTTPTQLLRRHEHVSECSP